MFTIPTVKMVRSLMTGNMINNNSRELCFSRLCTALCHIIKEPRDVLPHQSTDYVSRRGICIWLTTPIPKVGKNPDKDLLRASNDWVKKSSRHLETSAQSRSLWRPKKIPRTRCEDDGMRHIMDIYCKVAIITGGTSGIGYAAAYILLNNGAKCVVLSGRSRERGRRAAQDLGKIFGKDKVLYMQGDVNDEHHFRCLFEQTMKKFDHVDILFNNAGMLDDRHWECQVNTNMKAVIRGCFLGFEFMGKNSGGAGGVIVNNAAIWGLEPFVGAPVHSATKHGVIGITRNLGHDYHCCRTGVRVVALCPGVTSTNLSRDAAGKQCNEEWSNETRLALRKAPTQKASIVGKAFFHCVRDAPSGSVWVVEDSQLFELEPPDRHSYSEVVAWYK